MIEIITLTKTLNATEAGMTNTNDSYILIPQGIDGNLLFQSNGIYKIRDYISGDDFEFRYESGREQRVYKLGAYCRSNNIQCGDIITIEKRIIGDNSRFFINAQRKKNIIFIQKHKEGYFIIRNDIGNNIFNEDLNFSIFGDAFKLKIKFEGNVRKRKDSPDELPLYSVTLNYNKNLQEIIKAPYVELNWNNMTISYPDEIKLEIIRQ